MRSGWTALRVLAVISIQELVLEAVIFIVIFAELVRTD